MKAVTFKQLKDVLLETELEIRSDFWKENKDSKADIKKWTKELKDEVKACKKMKDVIQCEGLFPGCDEQEAAEMVCDQLDELFGLVIKGKK